jgi:hypothetical protein
VKSLIEAQTFFDLGAGGAATSHLMIWTKRGLYFFLGALARSAKISATDATSCERSTLLSRSRARWVDISLVSRYETLKAPAGTPIASANWYLRFENVLVDANSRYFTTFGFVGCGYSYLMTKSVITGTRGAAKHGQRR